MKLTVIALCFTVFQGFALIAHGQSAKVNLKMENVSIKQVLSLIEDQTNLFFIYNGKLVNVERKVNVNVENQNVNDVLKELFSGSNIKYEIENRQILLSNVEIVSGSNVQQQKTVSGKVTDSSGAPLPGVSVVVKGTTTGIITNAEGNYSLANVPAKATLVFSFVGMKAQEVAIENKSVINIALLEETVGIEEVVAVGYGTQKRATIVGSIATVQSRDLTVAPVANTSNALTGRLPGLITVQREGLPGSDAAALNIRGFGSPLIIVDGVEGSLDILNPNTIESISILKDGAASIYGARAGNGVVLVTTKRGGVEKPLFTFNTSFTGQSQTVFPSLASSGQQAEMDREILINQGRPESEVLPKIEDIKKYYDGSDPIYYPNTNWVKEVTRPWAPQQEHNISVRGGTERVKYFGFLGYLKQETMWKNNGGDYKKYNLQSNVDIKLHDDLDLQMDISGTQRNLNYPYRNESVEYPYLWQDLWYADPSQPAHFPDPTKLPYIQTNVPIYGVTNREIGGYNDTEILRMVGTMALNYRFKPVKGLSAKLLFSYLKDFNNQKLFNKGYQMWDYSYNDEIYTLRADTRAGTSIELSDTRNRNITTQFSLNYDHIFGDHHLTTTAVYEAIDYRYDNFRTTRTGFLSTAVDQLSGGTGTTATNLGSASEMGRQSYIGRLNYSYKGKYLLEASLRADASAKFPKEHRWGYFPSVQAGWRMSEEDFISDLGVFDNLKLKASYGQSGMDDFLNFQYLAGYQTQSIFGAYQFANTVYNGLYPTGLPNPNLTWEEMTIYNTGLEFSLWQRKLYGEAEAFYRKREGMQAMRSTSLPTTFGAALPQENLNSQDNRGFEVTLGTAGHVEDLKWDISGNISWSRSKWIHYEEPEYTDLDQVRINKRSGQWTDRVFGYVSDGLFTSQEEISNLGFNQDLNTTAPNSTLRPGDIRYINTNDDDKLDWKDQVEIGKGALPHWFVGLNANLSYKNFSLSTLFQGALGFYHYVDLYPTMEKYYELRWHPDNGISPENNDPNALVPRLGGASTNGLYSDYRLKKSDYLRLKVASLGYTLPKSLTNKVGISSMKIYVAGTNLLTFSGLKKFDLDPEVPPRPSSSTGGSAWSYPQQKTVTLGASLTF